MHKNEQYIYEHPKIEYYTDKNESIFLFRHL